MLLVSERWQRNAGRAGWRFVAAPDWPPPPAGWSPTPGWQPDPAWSTPPGWRWLRRRRLPIVLSTASALFLVGAVTSLLVWAEANGVVFDPTDPANYNDYALRNDSSTPLYVHRCADPNCASLQGEASWVAINPGSVDDEQVYWGSATPTAYAVATSPSDTGRRCLLLNAEHKTPGKLDIPLSSAGTCG
jgi:hypothetical protein